MNCCSIYFGEDCGFFANCSISYIDPKRIVSPFVRPSFLLYFSSSNCIFRTFLAF